jgi:hypothetical protein
MLFFGGRCNEPLPLLCRKEIFLMKKLLMLVMSAFCTFGMVSITGCGGEEETPPAPKVPDTPTPPDETPTPPGETPTPPDETPTPPGGEEK